MWLKASAAVVMLYKIFWVFTRRRFLVRNERFGTTCLSHLQGLVHLETLKMGQTSSPETLVETLKMGQTSSPETLVSYQKRRRVKAQKIL
jgi:hypothetical protein